MEDLILERIAYMLPATVTGFVAYYMFKKYLQQLRIDKRIGVRETQKKETLSIKLQAYERMVLFCDRVNPLKLAVRVSPISDNTSDYLQLLIGTINQELEHNFVQQIYISEDTWLAINATKATIIKKLEIIAKASNSATDLRENTLIEFGKTPLVTETAISIIKREVKQLI